MRYRTVLGDYRNGSLVSSYETKHIPKSIECGKISIGDTIVVAVEMTPGIKSVLDRSPLMKKYFVYDDETIELEFIVIDKRHIIESFGGELKNGDVVGGTVYLKPKSSFFVKLVTEI